MWYDAIVSIEEGESHLISDQSLTGEDVPVEDRIESWKKDPEIQRWEARKDELLKFAGQVDEVLEDLPVQVPDELVRTARVTGAVIEMLFGELSDEEREERYRLFEEYASELSEPQDDSSLS